MRKETIGYQLEETANVSCPQHRLWYTLLDGCINRYFPVDVSFRSSVKCDLYGCDRLDVVLIKGWALVYGEHPFR